MNRSIEHHERASPPRMRRKPWGLPLLLVLVAAGAPSASAGSCEDCPEPTMTALGAEADFRLDVRPGPLGMQSDYVETDGGECSATADGSPTYAMVNSWMVLRGRGEVWDCPHSRSCEKMVAETTEEDSSEWASTAEGSAGVTAFGVTVGAKLIEVLKNGFRLQTVTRLEKEMCAKYCHRVTWHAYFEVAEFRATLHVKIQRRYAWWTKNTYTGATVHAKGNIQVDCGTADVTFSRTAPIGGYFHLYDRPCEDASECEHVLPKDLGYHPPVLPPPPPPVTPTTPTSGAVDGGEATDGEKEGDGSTPVVPADGDDVEPADLGDPPAGPVCVAPGFSPCIPGPVSPEDADASDDTAGWVEPALEESVR